MSQFQSTVKMLPDSQNTLIRSSAIQLPQFYRQQNCAIEELENLKLKSWIKIGRDRIRKYPPVRAKGCSFLYTGYLLVIEAKLACFGSECRNWCEIAINAHP